jgi:hypothetical protein
VSALSTASAGPIVTIPEVAVIDEIKDEIQDVRTYYFSFENPEAGRAFRVKSGQFVMCTVFGAGEFAVSLPFSPEGDRPHLSVRGVGKVTRALHELRPGDKIGLRGPFGNGFPSPGSRAGTSSTPRAASASSPCARPSSTSSSTGRTSAASSSSTGRAPRRT